MRGVGFRARFGFTLGPRVGGGGGSSGGVRRWRVGEESGAVLAEPVVGAARVADEEVALRVFDGEGVVVSIQGRDGGFRVGGPEGDV